MAPEFRVCLICHPFFPTAERGLGIDRYALELKRYLENAGIEVIVIGRMVASVGERLLGNVSTLRALKGVSADVYHAVSPLCIVPALLSGRRPLVTTVHDVIQVEGRISPSLSWKRLLFSVENRFSTRLAIRSSPWLIVPSETTRQILLEKFRRRSTLTRLVRWGIDHSQFSPDSPNPARGEGSGRGVGGPRILYVGELTVAKGVDTVIRAFARVAAQVPGSNLSLVGKTQGRDYQSLRQLITRLGLGDAVQFEGFVPDAELAAHYQQADAFVFVSRYGFSLAIFEAMACGVPTVVSSRREAPEYVGDAAVVVDPEDVDALAASLVRILTDRPFADELRRRGLARTREFSWRRMSEETLTVYREAVAATDGHSHQA
jgi:glycosyltransferase involved in cell wall biosynthesis